MKDVYLDFSSTIWFLQRLSYFRLLLEAKTKLMQLYIKF